MMTYNKETTAPLYADPSKARRYTEIASSGQWVMRVTSKGFVEFNQNLTPTEGSEQAFRMLLELAENYNMSLCETLDAEAQEC